MGHRIAGPAGTPAQLEARSAPDLLSRYEGIQGFFDPVNRTSADHEAATAITLRPPTAGDLRGLLVLRMTEEILVDPLLVLLPRIAMKPINAADLVGMSATDAVGVIKDIESFFERTPRSQTRTSPNSGS